MRREYARRGHTHPGTNIRRGHIHTVECTQDRVYTVTGCRSALGEAESGEPEGGGKRSAGFEY